MDTLYSRTAGTESLWRRGALGNSTGATVNAIETKKFFAIDNADKSPKKKVIFIRVVDSTI